MTVSAGEPLQPAQLLELARSRAPGDRERLLMTVADLCNQSHDCARPEIQAVLQAILMDLATDAEHRIRVALSERLAASPWAPHGLVAMLARDDIEIARPIIAQSPVLTDHDLVRLLVEATVEHQIEVARRPKLDAEVVDVVMSQGDPDVLAALAGNASAKVSPLALSRLVGFSERMAAIRAPLARHPMLTSDLAGLLYGWVGESLRMALTQRFEVDHAGLHKALGDSMQDVHPGASGWNVKAEDGEGGEDRLGMERRVVQKLQAAGQLRPGLLIRALHEGRLSLFTLALAALGGSTPEAVKAAINSEGPKRLAEACTAVGIDRGAFPTVLSLVRRLNEGRPGGEAGADGLDADDEGPAPPRSRRRPSGV